MILEPIVHAETPEAGLRAAAIAIAVHGRLPILMSAVATKVGQWCNDADGRTVEQCAEILELPVDDVIDLRLRGGG